VLTLLFFLKKIDILFGVQESWSRGPYRKSPSWSPKGRASRASWVYTWMEYKAKVLSCCAVCAFSGVEELASHWHCGGIYFSLLKSSAE
jgi:hypothetical protein